jgi:mono/diheme cytochrome c family protein
MKKYNQIVFPLIIGLIISLSACQQAGKNSTGSEYIPDMAHGVAFEANLYSYYYQNTWGTESEKHTMSSPRIPVNGSRPRSQATDALAMANKGMSSHQGISIPVNGSVPYYYANTEEDRLRAMAEIINNPYPITTAGLAKGKELYDIFCAICHGEKADGAGYLVRDGGKYPVQPANFLLDEHVQATNGRYYHAIFHGRNLMGNYKDKLSYEERWQVIHYIRSLQAASKNLVYSEKENTFRTVEIPAEVLKAKAESEKAISAVITKENQ